MIKVLNISDFMNEKCIVDIKSNTKDAALKELLEVICQSDKITDTQEFTQSIFAREKLMSTGIGYGIAIPHVRLSSVKDFVIALGRKREGLHYESIDDKPVKLIFMIGASDKQDKDYIKLLSRLVLRLKNGEFVEKIMNAPGAKEIYQTIREQK